MKVIEVIVVAALFVLLGGIGGYFVGKARAGASKIQAEVRAEDQKRIRRNYRFAVEALDKVEDLARRYLTTMVESPLATDILQVRREFNNRREIE